MNMDKVVNIFAMLVIVAGVTTVVARPNSANVIRAFGETFTNSIKAAMGAGSVN
jgi:uncharacterized membrane protein